MQEHSPGFASLDRSARRWPLATMFLWCAKGPVGRFAHQRNMEATSHAAETQSRRRRRSEAEESRSDLTASRRRGPPTREATRLFRVQHRLLQRPDPGAPAAIRFLLLHARHSRGSPVRASPRRQRGSSAWRASALFSESVHFGISDRSKSRQRSASCGGASSVTDHSRKVRSPSTIPSRCMTPS